jgi:hypothetical protein
MVGLSRALISSEVRRRGRIDVRQAGDGNMLEQHGRGLQGRGDAGT